MSVSYKTAPFTGHMYRILDRQARLDFIDRIYSFGIMRPEGPVKLSGRRNPGDRVMDMGDGWVLTTLEPARLRVLFPNIDDMRSISVRSGERAA